MLTSTCIGSSANTDIILTSFKQSFALGVVLVYKPLHPPEEVSCFPFQLEPVCIYKGEG